MTIRRITRDDLDFCVELVAAENWLSETRAVFQAALSYDPNGCFVAEADGRTVGIIVATAYENCGFLGELIVVPERRGQGLGRKLMTRAIDYLKSRGCASVYLDGDLPAVPLYERLGFRVLCKSLRFLGRIDGSPSPIVRPMVASDLDTIFEMDRTAFGADRSFFLKFRFEHFPALCHTLTADRRPCGFIMGAPGRDIVTVGPWLVPNSVADALSLLGALAAQAGNSRLRIGILENNSGPVETIRSLGSFDETEPSFRMVLGNDCCLGAASELWAVGSPAKG